MGKRESPEVHPYAVFGALLAAELDVTPPRLSRKRKRLRAAIRSRLATLVAEPEPGRASPPEDSASRPA